MTHDEYLEQMEKYMQALDATHKRAKEYNKIVLTAGYGSFFGLWHLTKEYIDVQLAIWSALLITLSATVFVMSEVLGAYIASVGVLRWRKSALEATDQTNSDEEGDDTEEERPTPDNLRAILWWNVVFWTALTLALGAVGTLLVAFLTRLCVTGMSPTTLPAF